MKAFMGLLMWNGFEFFVNFGGGLTGAGASKYAMDPISPGSFGISRSLPSRPLRFYWSSEDVTEGGVWTHHSTLLKFVFVLMQRCHYRNSIQTLTGFRDLFKTFSVKVVGVTSRHALMTRLDAN